MISTIESFLFIVNVVAIVSFIIVAVLMIAIRFRTNSRNFINSLFRLKLAKIAFPTFIISFCLMFSLGVVICKIARKEIQNSVKLGNKNRLYVNGVLTDNDSIIKSIKLISPTTEYKNVGDSQIRVILNHIKLRLVRDFSNKNIYWVFYENYDSTSRNCVGQIETQHLAEYR